MTIYSIIEKKIKNTPLTGAEIKFFADGFSEGSVLPEQAAAFCAAVCINGMTDGEIAALTVAMRDSGDVVDLSDIDGIKVDKHSTGGVGDTTTMIAVPILAAAGLKVAKMSGRSLGHTGGTIDKLESYKGYTAELNEADFKRIVKECGAAIISQSADIAPADKKLYALRDRTGTVNSIPLIASSVMSKKLALGADIIALDVKYGSGAFMKTAADAERLGKCMVDIGKSAGKKIAAVITSMEQPLSYAVGCNLELNAAAAVLSGEKNDLYTVSRKLCGVILALSGMDEDITDKVLESGAALTKLAEIVSAQGGEFVKQLPVSNFKLTVTAKASGYIQKIDTEEIGIINSELGGGRLSGNIGIDHTVGIFMKKRLGDRVASGEVLAEIYGKKADVLSGRLLGAFTVSAEKPVIPALIYKVIY